MRPAQQSIRRLASTAPGKSVCSAQAIIIWMRAGADHVRIETDACPVMKRGVLNVKLGGTCIKQMAYRESAGNALKTRVILNCVKSAILRTRRLCAHFVMILRTTH